MEEKYDVMEGADTSEGSSPESTEQEAIVSEDVKDTASDVQNNLRIALQKERERRKAAEAQLQQTRYEAPAIEEDEAVRRFTNVEAITLINNKILTDPTFKDRADLVQDEMRRTGKTIDDADNAVLARLFRDMISNQEPEKTSTKSIKQLPNTAIPETQAKVSAETQAELDMFDSMAKSFGDM